MTLLRQRKVKSKNMKNSKKILNDDELEYS